MGRRSEDRKKKRGRLLWLLAALCFLVSFLVILIMGSTYTCKIDCPKDFSEDRLDEITVEIEQDEEIIRITDKSFADGKLYLKFESVSRGKAYFMVYRGDELFFMDLVYVHRLNIMTVNSYMGYSRGSRVIPFTVLAFLIGLLVYSVISYREGIRESLYQYKNVRNLSWIFFTTSLILNQFLFVFNTQALEERLRSVMSSASNMATFAFPVAFAVSVLVCISNVLLMKKEGRSWRNMLGVIMSIVICLGTVIPPFLSDWMYNHQTIIDIHNEGSVWPYLDLLVTNLMLVLVSYLECILLGTIVLTVKAAKKVPSFDKDYILILGCQIRKDGTLTKLLQGRADRALEFARMQKEAASRELTFVPSGGQGSDEVMAEAQAIHHYLLQQGVPENHILVEDGSSTTRENMQKSFALISRREGMREPKIAFATTNYHVFRSGILAHDEGLQAEGIGSPTRTYFWVNAFIREFVATVFSERKVHSQVIRATSLMVVLACSFLYLANTL